jgi:hypothetical protein
MSNAMNQFKETAQVHMRRDIETAGKWICTCEACHAIRSLLGMEKMLGVRPLVRQMEETEDLLKDLPDGPEKRRLLGHYLQLHDRLAEELAK